MDSLYYTPLCTDAQWLWKTHDCPGQTPAGIQLNEECEAGQADASWKHKFMRLNNQCTLSDFKKKKNLKHESKKQNKKSLGLKVLNQYIKYANLCDPGAQNQS